jgi:hypothetical protein
LICISSHDLLPKLKSRKVLMAEDNERGGASVNETVLGSAPESASPVAAASENNEEWILTVDRSSGDVVKVERLDPASGERRELSLDEYAAFSSEGAEVAEDYSAYGDGPYAEYTHMGMMKGTSRAWPIWSLP